MFSEKLDSLMSIADVNNTKLSKNINLTSSYISRLRNGSRQLPKSHDFIEPLCNYLAHSIRKDHQIQSLKNIIGIDIDEYTSIEEIASIFKMYLLDDADFEKNKRISSGKENLSESGNLKIMPYYYGDVGKRKAVEQFFLMILEEKSPQLIRLYSDESMSWMIDDKDFSMKWAELFRQVLLRGNKVHIIHSINRNMSELIESVLKWTPLYATGMITPFYYPRLKDGIFRNTMFIAEKTAAIVSSSIQEHTDDMLNIFITDKTAIQSLILKYNNYNNLCIPLMQIYKKDNMNEIFTKLESMLSKDGDIIISNKIASFFAMPQSVIDSIRSRIDNKHFYDLYIKLNSIFMKNISSFNVRSISSTIEPFSDSIEIAFSDLLCGKTLYYTEDEYNAHINYIKTLSDDKNNLFTLVEKDNFIYPNNLIIKRGVSVMFSATDSSYTTFFFNEANMVHAFWDYFDIFAR